MENIIFLPGNVPSSKNSRQSMTIDTKPYYNKNGKLKTYRNVNIPSKLTLAYKQMIMPYMLEARPKWLAMKQGLEGVLKVEFTFIRESRRTFDYINAAQIIQDMMQEMSWIENDNCNFLKPYFGDFKYDKENPGVEIRLIKNVTIEYV